MTLFFSFSFRGLIGKRLQEKSTPYAKRPATATQRERERVRFLPIPRKSNSLSISLWPLPRRKPRQNLSWKKMLRALTAPTTLTSMQLKLGSILVLIALVSHTLTSLPIPYIVPFEIQSILFLFCQLMFRSVTISSIFPSPHSFQIHWWPCQLDLAKHSLPRLLCITTSDGFLKVFFLTQKSIFRIRQAFTSSSFLHRQNSLHCSFSTIGLAADRSMPQYCGNTSSNNYSHFSFTFTFCFIKSIQYLPELNFIAGMDS